MALYDASLPIREGMVTFPGDPPFSMRPFFERQKGDPFDLALLSLGTHLGTHVDPPAHYLDGGSTVDQIPPDVLIGPGAVLDMRGRACVDRAALEAAWVSGIQRVLLKTNNGQRLLEPTFYEDYVSLTEDGAGFLVEQKVRLVGIDYLSIERYRNPGAPVHLTLLRAGILVVEGVHLLDVPAGPCEIYCLPLKIFGGDGAPARVILKFP
ncbi:MAG: cyclase family protein [Thermodesulfobacteriota bacterium]